MPAPIPSLSPTHAAMAARPTAPQNVWRPTASGFSFATISDQAPGFRTHFSDGTPDHTSIRIAPGFRFSDVERRDANLAADQAYDRETHAHGLPTPGRRTTRCSIAMARSSPRFCSMNWSRPLSLLTGSALRE